MPPKTPTLQDLQKFKKSTSTTPTLADLQKFKKPAIKPVGKAEAVLSGVIRGESPDGRGLELNPTVKKGLSRAGEIFREENPFSKKGQVIPQTLPESVAKQALYH